MSKRRFIVAIDGMTKEEERKFIEWIRSEGFGWWHWISNLWLLTSRSEETSAKKIRDQIGELSDHRHNLVIEIPEDIDWQGYGPSNEKRNMFNWLKTTWLDK